MNIRQFTWQLLEVTHWLFIMDSSQIENKQLLLSATLQTVSHLPKTGQNKINKKQKNKQTSKHKKLLPK